MLARRRNRLGKGGAAAAAPSFDNAAAANATSASGVALPATSSTRTEKSVDTLVGELLDSFACPLPSLINNTVDEDFDSSQTEDMYLVEGSGAASQHPIRLTHGLLLMYLHIGNAPPDFPRIEPCAKTECWIDPLSMYALHGGSYHRSARSVSESIAEALERQYGQILGDDVHMLRVAEASNESSRSALGKVRRLGRGGRVLVHYNGHGMPRATDLGEVWVFDRDRAHYVPLNITEMAELVGTPALYVLDCNAAGAVLRRWQKDRLHEARPHDLFICACDAHETLPLNPLLPADMLTSCLTTPLRMVLEWYIGYSPYRVLLPQVTEEMIRNMPGNLSDCCSPRGELSWILNAITTTIAWSTLPAAEFHYLFRRDPATRAIFRNAILADRYMRAAGVTPLTYPPLPVEVHLHPLWDLWDYILERTISQLPRLMAPAEDTVSGVAIVPNAVYERSTFLEDQLTAFEVWIHAGTMSQVPQELPCVLLALVQTAYQVRAFVLLTKYLDSCPMAGRRTIRCGILPYLSKILAHVPEVYLMVCVLWMQMIRANPSECCTEIQRMQCEKYFTGLLRLDDSATRIEPIESLQKVVGADRGPGAMAPRSDSFSSASPAQQHPRFAKSPQLSNTTPCRVAMRSSLDAVSDDGAPDAARSRGASGTDLEGCTSAGAQPLQPAQKLCGIPNHVLHPGGSTYYLIKGVDLARCKSMACYILCQLLRQGVRQCLLYWNDRLLNVAFPCLKSGSADLRSWACLVLATLFSGLRHAKNFASRECASRLDLFTHQLQDRSPIVRSSCVTLLASIVGVRVDLLPTDQQTRRLQMEKSLLIKVRQYLFDASMSMREELIFFACQVLYAYGDALESSTTQPESNPSRSGFSLAKIQEYVEAVGRDSPRWALEEPDVQVKSLLNVSRPTVNTIFDDTVIFETAILPADDPPPSPAALDLTRLAPQSLIMMQGLLHDAALMLMKLFSNCDAAHVKQALQGLSSGVAPESRRFAAEVLRTMSHVASLDSASLSEADRARATWNADRMRQLVLDIHSRRLQPQGSSLDPGQDADIPATALAGVQVARNAPLRCQVLPSLLSSESVVCAAFRALEAAFVVATKDQYLNYISYEDYNAQIPLNRFAVRQAGPIHDILVINDLSEQSGLLLVNKHGGFTLLKNCWERDSIPVEAGVFSACPPPPENRWIDLKSVYRAHTATLFYGGPIGASGEVEIHALSLAEEQVTRRLSVSGGSSLTCLAAHTTQCAILAGFSDGVVRYYDDRQRQDQMSMVGMLQCASSSSGGVEAVLGVGPVAAATTHHFNVVAATRCALYIFDSRKLAEPVRIMTLEDFLTAGNAGPSATGAATHEGGVGGLPFITGCSVSVHTGLIGLSLSNQSCAALNTKGQILYARSMRVASHAATGAQKALSPALPPPTLLPASCVVHPLRQLLTFEGDLMFL